jgi:rare lipoprotein A
MFLGITYMHFMSYAFRPHFIITCCLALSITACGFGSDDAVVGDSAYYDSDTPKIEKQRVGKPYQIGGKWYTPAIDSDYDEVGIASWYGPGFHGRPTANGEKFDENGISAAHTTLPLPSYVMVTNLDNGKQLYVRINDRGPFEDDRILDLSKRAAELLGSKNTGLARVRVRLAEPPYNVTLISPDGQKKIGTTKQTNSSEILIANNNNNRQQETKTAYNNLPLYQGNNQVNTPLIKNTPMQPIAQPIINNNYPQDYATATTRPNNSILSDTYAVKIGVFSDPNNISNLQRNLASLGTVQVNPIYRQGKMLSEISLNGYKTQQEALNTLDALTQLGINDAIIITK